MSPQQTCLLVGLLLGAVGGTVAYLDVVFDGFKEVKPMSKSKVAIKQRLFFWLMRTTKGAVVGFVAALFLVSRVVSGDLDYYQFSAITTIAGFTSKFIPSQGLQGKK